MNKTIRKAFKFRLDAPPEARQKLVDYTGMGRFVWNKALALNLARLDEGLPVMWYAELEFWAGMWKDSAEYGFLKAMPSQALQQKLMDLDKAFRDAFDKGQPLKRIPVFKRKGQPSGIRFPQGFKVDEGRSRLYLPKVGWVRYRNSRKVEGIPKSVTVTGKGGHWFASIQVEFEAPAAIHPSTSMVGIDMGIKRFATLSDGTVYVPLNAFKTGRGTLARLQRQLKNKKKSSKNRKKLKAKIARCHEKMANARHDFLQKTSTDISKNHAVTVVEDLKVANMSKSAKGTVERPGNHVPQKSGLNRSILDQGWGMFFGMLAYKQDWLGGMLLKVPPQGTSQECPPCGHKSPDNRLAQASFVCVACGFEENADLVGAMNVKSRGHRLLACEVNGAVMPSAAGTGGKQRCKPAPGPRRESPVL